MHQYHLLIFLLLLRLKDHAANRSLSIAGVAAAARLWNLRIIKAVCRDESPVKIEIGVKRGVDEEEMDKDEKLKFSVSLLEVVYEPLKLLTLSGFASPYSDLQTSYC
ncbi:hypothetical protein HID58_071284 [Brassica napus]|uniref:Uncharacterized protein n=1 Tax=Brassica napus TaxID=3708 RepID=A0ABQ7Z1A9_BRANA|nr:hypothetical protein HID58_071284 [Brassica napus]